MLSTERENVYAKATVERVSNGSAEAGYMIGSGPIESANRNVVQQRLKLSGQKWSIQGVQRIVNLRASKK